MEFRPDPVYAAAGGVRGKLPDPDTVSQRQTEAREQPAQGARDGTQLPASVAIEFDGSKLTTRTIRGAHVSTEHGPGGGLTVGVSDDTGEARGETGSSDGYAVRHHIRTFRESHTMEHRRDPESGHVVINNYVLGELLGKGSFADVYHAIDVEAAANEAREYAVKVLMRRRLRKLSRPGRGAQSTGMEDLGREIAIMKRACHPNVIDVAEYIQGPERVYIVLEFCEGGPCMVLDQRGKGTALALETARKFTRDIVAGLDYLHRQHIIHRDIKPSNCLVDVSGTVKIADFGASVELEQEGDDDTIQGTRGTPAFLAPEIVSRGVVAHGRPSDIWALGCTLYAFVLGRIPFAPDPTMRSPMRTMLSLNEAIRTQQPLFPDDGSLPEELVELLERMLCKDPANRATMSDLLHDPWLTSHGAEPIKQSVAGNVDVSDEDVGAAITPIAENPPPRASLKRAVALLKAVGSLKAMARKAKTAHSAARTHAPPMVGLSRAGSSGSSILGTRSPRSPRSPRLPIATGTSVGEAAQHNGGQQEDGSAVLSYSSYSSASNSSSTSSATSSSASSSSSRSPTLD